MANVNEPGEASADLAFFALPTCARTNACDNTSQRCKCTTDQMLLVDDVTSAKPRRMKAEQESNHGPFPFCSTRPRCVWCSTLLESPRRNDGGQASATEQNDMRIQSESASATNGGCTQQRTLRFGVKPKLCGTDLQTMRKGAFLRVGQQCHEFLDERGLVGK